MVALSSDRLMMLPPNAATPCCRHCATISFMFQGSIGLKSRITGALPVDCVNPAGPKSTARSAGSSGSSVTTTSARARNSTGDRHGNAHVVAAPSRASPEESNMPTGPNFAVSRRATAAARAPVPIMPTRRLSLFRTRSPLEQLDGFPTLEDGRETRDADRQRCVMGSRGGRATGILDDGHAISKVESLADGAFHYHVRERTGNHHVANVGIAQ